MAKKTVVIYSVITVEPIQGLTVKGAEQITAVPVNGVGGLRGRIYRGEITRVKSGLDSVVDYDIANNLESYERAIEVSTSAVGSDITQNIEDYYVEIDFYGRPSFEVKPPNNIGKHAVFNASNGEWVVDKTIANTALRAEVEAACDELLAATDYTQVNDITTNGFLTSTQVTAYANYRAALRDLRGGNGFTHDGVTFNGINNNMVSIDQVTFPNPPTGSGIETPTAPNDDPSIDPDFNFDFR
jgi:hypothetical protein